MGALVLKSGNALSANIDSLDFLSYKQRVLADGGVIHNETAVKDAMAFVRAKGIAIAEVFSATSASWGYKASGGKPVKLYSLFGATGDLDAKIVNAGDIDFNKTRYNHPVVEFRITLQSINGLHTVGKTGVVNNSGICVVSKVPVLSAGTDYGNEITMTLGQLADLSDSADTAMARAKRMQSIEYQRAAKETMPNQWYFIGYDSATPPTQPKTTTTLTDASVWRSAATFLRAGAFNIYSAGVSVASESKGTIDAIYNKDLSFVVGHSKPSAALTEKWQGSLHADVAEAWCMVNTSEATMKALSTRSQVYI